MTYELRTYTVVPGRLGDLLDRFRDHTLALFDRHNIESVGYWTEPARPDVLVYLVRHRGDPVRAWESFAADPRWVAARAASVADGELTTNIDSRFLSPTMFSPLK